MKVDARHVALTYLDAHAANDLEVLNRLFKDDIQFVSPTRTMSGAAKVIEAIRRLSSVHVRNDLRQLCVFGDEVCLVYDFVTDTSVAVVPTVEWLYLGSARLVQEGRRACGWRR